MYGYRAYISPQLKNRLGYSTLETFVGDEIDIPSIIDARDGFWVNYKFEFTRGEDAVIWIPANQVVYVEKR